MSTEQRTPKDYPRHDFECASVSWSGPCTCGLNALLSAPPPLPTGETAQRIVSAEDLRWLCQYVEWNGAVHEDGCPADDTCNCDGKPMNDAVNSLCRALNQAQPPVVAPERHTGEQEPRWTCPSCGVTEHVHLCPQALQPPSPVDEAKSIFLRAYMDCLHGRADGITTVPLMDALIASVRADERQQVDASLQAEYGNPGGNIRDYINAILDDRNEIWDKLTAAQQEIARLTAERDRLDCTRREGGDTRHCRLDRKCLRCRAEQAESALAQARARARQVFEAGLEDAEPAEEGEVWGQHVERRFAAYLATHPPQEEKP